MSSPDPLVLQSVVVLKSHAKTKAAATKMFPRRETYLKIEETPNTWRFRVHPPTDFRKGTYTTIVPKPGLNLVFAKLKPAVRRAKIGPWRLVESVCDVGSEAEYPCEATYANQATGARAKFGVTRARSRGRIPKRSMNIDRLVNQRGMMRQNPSEEGLDYIKLLNHAMLEGLPIQVTVSDSGHDYITLSSMVVTSAGRTKKVHAEVFLHPHYVVARGNVYKLSHRERARLEKMAAGILAQRMRDTTR